MEKRYYRAKEVANYLGVSVTTVWNYAKDGFITPIKMTSQATVFNIEEVEKFVQSRIIKVAQ